MKPKPFVHRAFATVLAATMLCSLTPAAAFGAEEDVADASGAAEASEGSVAQVGDKSYDTLLEAINAASEGDTIKLLRDFEVADEVIGERTTEYNLKKGSTLDLNGHTVTVSKTLMAVFQGENATIKNGRIASPSNLPLDNSEIDLVNYPLFIGNGTANTSITVQNVTSNGGINVFVASVTLIDCTFDASSKKFYAIWADPAGEITVESGTYTGGKNSEDDNAPSVNDCGTETTISISGGTFNTDVAKYLTGCATQTGSGDKYVVSAEHVWTGDSTVTSRPTCTSSGKERVQCEYCTTTRDFTLPALGHAFGAWETDVEPTCDEAGSKTRACLRCSVSQTEAVPALGHAWEDSPTVDVPPTCTEDGSESVHCARCSETKDAATLPAPGHDFGEGVTTTEPTATQDGVLTFTCAVCGATRTEPIPATGPAPHEHGFAGAPWERDAHAHWRTCTVPGCNVASAKEPHAFGGWTTEKEPTTAEEGAQARACGVCGFTERKAIPALEPDANGWVEDADGTWQLVDEDGGLVEEGWQEVGGDWYYFSDSAMQTGWEQVNGEWYYLKESGAMATGWQEVDGTWYYLEQSGAMATGWQKVGGAWYYLSGAGEGVEGSMATGWKKDGATWYYLAEKGEGTEGAMATGWRLVDGAWYRFKGSGAMLSGWQKVGRAWYLLNATHDGTFGRMLEGWQRVDGRTGKPTSANSWYYLRPGSGAMAANTRVGGYYVGPDGRWRPGR